MKKERLVELDGLRGIAAVAVVVFHFLYHYDAIFGHSFDVPEIINAGRYGVDLFFMISGFVIFWTLSRTKRPVDFIWSRFSRLYPVYWVCVILTFSIVSLFALEGRVVDVSTLVANLFMFHEYLGFAHVDGVYWTLTIELAFYFWMLVVFIFGAIKHAEKIMLYWIITVASLAISRTPMSDAAVDFFIVYYINLFAMGMCFFKYREGTSTQWTHALMLTAVLLTIITLSLYKLVLVSLFFVTFVLIINDKLGFLKSSLLVYLGSISYSLYLIHQNIGYVIIGEFYRYNLSPLWGVSAALVVSFVLAHVLMVWVERPSLHYLRDYYKSKIQRKGNMSEG